MKFINAFGEQGNIELFLKKWGFWALITFALCYYGYYFNVWPGPYGEGGLVAVLAQRLMEGQRPIVDTFLGYNVLWFYPVVAVFKLAGPNYVALRLFFFALSLATGLMGWRLMLSCTGRASIAFLAGLLMIGLPGQMYRNYMSFLVVLNLATFLSAYVIPQRGIKDRLLWMAASGVALGIAYLTRVDLGFLLTFILIGLILIFPLNNKDKNAFRSRAGLAILGLALGAVGLVLTHLPVWMDAKHRGFEPEFSKQYIQWQQMITFNAGRITKSATEACVEFLSHLAKPPATTLRLSAHPLPATADRVSSSAGNVAARVPTPTKLTVASLEKPQWEGSNTRRKIFFLNIYLPIPCAILIALAGFWAWFSGLFFKDSRRTVLGLSLLTSLGCSLVLFPQYYWWRPDMVHLSEFMVPMMFTLILSLFIAAELQRRCRLFGRVMAALMAALGFVTLLLYANNGFQSGSTGGIAVSQHKTVMFHALNGVDVRMKPEERTLNNALFQIVTGASDRGEPVICYPYNPEINFMTDRPSYEYNLYADNDIPTDQFCKQEIALIEKNHPPVVIFNNWDINGTEESRFCNWAAPLCRYVS